MKIPQSFRCFNCFMVQGVEIGLGNHTAVAQKIYPTHGASLKWKNNTFSGGRLTVAPNWHDSLDPTISPQKHIFFASAG